MVVDFIIVVIVAICLYYDYYGFSVKILIKFSANSIQGINNATVSFAFNVLYEDNNSIILKIFSKYNIVIL